MRSFDNLVENGGQILTYKVNDVEYAVDIKMVTDIIELPEITVVPLMPEYIKGVINLRGKVVPVIDMRERFSLDKINYDKKTCVIIITIQEISVGLIVDRVVDAENITTADIEESLRKNSYVSHIINLNGKMKLLVDYDKIIA
ncbi:MAG: purine-binding chemotaxis protein CheW [Oscillospiraceae bacterium]|nr:purine-binding chemotaxis protein CheW [Oscillospiraceae bacterium]MBQ8378113.1 purine-binding chemotaxis protein CheW [Oscillospiraceae bacterium]MBQ8884136.1 purine-binding chemotaxis protein CheW [Oscillospiraceae bacterium]